MSGTTRFLAASVARMPGSVIEQLLAMRRAIAPFNAARGLHTALLYTGGWFVQWHEGPDDAVERTWKISLSHTTHFHPRVVHRSQGAGVLRESVQIAALFGHDKPTDVARKLFKLEREPDHSPIDIWRRFAAPTAHAASQVVCIVSEHAESVELVKALAERCRVPVNYQRFAGPDLRTSDAGAAYVDVGGGARGTRVQALSRHVLDLGIVHLSIPHVDRVVLLPGRRPQSAQTLSEAIAPFVDALRPRPAIHVVGADGGEPLRAMLETLVHECV